MFRTATVLAQTVLAFVFLALLVHHWISAQHGFKETSVS